MGAALLDRRQWAHMECVAQASAAIGGHMSTLSDELREHMRKLGQKGGAQWPLDNQQP